MVKPEFVGMKSATQSAMNAAAVERLIPAKQWMTSGRVWSQFSTKAINALT